MYLVRWLVPLTGDTFPPLKALVEGPGIVETVLGELVVLGEVGDADTLITLCRREGGIELGELMPTT